MNREQTLRFIVEHEILPAGKFGQNFLCDEKIISSIIGLCDIRKGDKVIEIGPGIGALTRELSSLDCNITAVEIDKKLGNILKDEIPSAEIIVEDFLKYIPKKAYDIAVSNIPYYVMTPIMIRLLSSFSSCRKMVFMVEEDAIRRIDAVPGTKQYGPLSILCSLYGDFRKEFTVPSGCFIPPPHTSSAVITLSRKDGWDIPSGFAAFLDQCFRERRKKLLNNLSSVYSKEKAIEAISAAGLAPDVRAEAVPPSKFATLFDKML